MTFEEFSTKHFPNLLPTGYILRDRYPDRWIRFHSLPEAKRYPDTNAEFAAVLERMNELASFALGEGEPCWLVHSLYNGIEQQPDARNPDWKHNWSISFEINDPDLVDPGDRFVVYECSTAWNAGQFDNILKDVADNAFHGLSWISKNTATVFAPYDGGVDFILPTEQDALEMRNLYPGWLSRRPDGL